MENVKVKWYRETYVPKGSPVKENIERERTTCIIALNDDEYTGSVGLFYKDHANRRVANKQSFRKAVLEVKDKATRIQLWDFFKEKYQKCVNC